MSQAQFHSHYPDEIVKVEIREKDELQNQSTMIHGTNLRKLSGLRGHRKFRVSNKIFLNLKS